MIEPIIDTLPDGTNLLARIENVGKIPYHFNRPADAQEWINEHKAEYPGYDLTIWIFRNNYKDVWIKISPSEPLDAEIKNSKGNDHSVKSNV